MHHNNRVPEESEAENPNSETSCKMLEGQNAGALAKNTRTDTQLNKHKSKNPVKHVQKQAHSQPVSQSVSQSVNHSNQ